MKLVGTIGHGAQTYNSLKEGATSLVNSYDQYQQGNYLEAAKGLAVGTLAVVGAYRSGLTTAKMLSGRFDPVIMRRLKPGESSVKGCFAAGTPISDIVRGDGDRGSNPAIFCSPETMDS